MNEDRIERLKLKPSSGSGRYADRQLEFMRTLQDLINIDEPALRLIREWAAEAVRAVELLAPSTDREDALLRTQDTTGSPLGAIVYETGGILVDSGWLRVLGSGHPRLTRTLPGWNDGRADGFYLVADDAVGGFFAINGGAFGPHTKSLYYFAPDRLVWEPLERGFSQFLVWAVTGGLDQFYESIRWPGWQSDVAALHGDRCFFFSPPLFTEPGCGGRRRGEVPVHESWDVQMAFREQLGW
jgi:hypothetical protein